uniref:hypothetical protein n=1 Tax=Paenibacillus sp. FSL R7-0345 TaxID=2954535 RepID=UPI00406C694C
MRRGCRLRLYYRRSDHFRLRNPACSECPWSDPAKLMAFHHFCLGCGHAHHRLNQ